VRPLETRRIDLPGDPDGAELAIHEIAGSGRAFVLLHGLTGHRDDFRGVLPQLAEGNDRRWIAPDLRGHGDFSHVGRGRADSFTFDSLVADLAALLPALGIERCDLLGHSFGGMVALRFVLAHPERVSSLVLMDTGPVAPDGYDVALFEKAGAIGCARGMAFLQSKVEQVARANPDPSPSDRQTLKWADSYWLHHRLRYTAMDPVAYAALGVAMVEQEPVVARLGEIDCPTSILVGEDDVEFLRGADLMQAGLPRATRVTLPDAGHHPHRESPEAWLAAMRDHLARC
jgi:pimeloyl-ACP methyl ester carboxylesterase